MSKLGIEYHSTASMISEQGIDITSCRSHTHTVDFTVLFQRLCEVYISMFEVYFKFDLWVSV